MAIVRNKRKVLSVDGKVTVIRQVKVKVKQSRYRPRVAQRVPESQGSQIS
jgi:hypothetical protein